MATTPATTNEHPPIRTQSLIFDLDSFEDVLLVKDVPFSPVTSVEEALEKVSGDSSKLLNLINEGLRAETRRTAKADPNGWHTFDDEGEINGEWHGTPADSKTVNSLKLTLAKTVFGYSKDLTLAEKKAAKESAEQMIKNSPQIKAGLQKSARLGATETE